MFKTVFFDTNKATFKPVTLTKLNEAADIMKKYKKAKFSIKGHTDRIGNDQFNQELSDKRANAVKEYLINNDVSANNLQAKSFGESQPIESNMYNAVRAKNRRVVVKLVE